MNETLLTVILGWFAFISLTTAVITAIDKDRAKNGSFRISEKKLIILALLGGSVAEYAVMKLIRHKTLHKKFMIGLPVIILLQLLLIGFILIRFPF